MNERLAHLLQDNRAEKFGRDRGRGKKILSGTLEERKYHQVRFSMKKHLRRSSSQVHCGNAKIHAKLLQQMQVPQVFTVSMSFKA